MGVGVGGDLDFLPLSSAEAGGEFGFEKESPLLLLMCCWDMVDNDCCSCRNSAGPKAEEEAKGCPGGNC